MDKNNEWVSFGNGLGRFCNPTQARSQETIRELAKEFGEILKRALSLNPNLNAHAAMWWALVGIRKDLDLFEQELLKDLWHLKAFMPEIFDLSVLPAPPKVIEPLKKKSSMKAASKKRALKKNRT